MGKRIYLDWNATAPCLPEARDRVAEVTALLRGNPSSLHAEGRAARDLLEDARARIAACIGAQPSGIVFTGGGTEANNLAIGLARGAAAVSERRLLASKIEHASLLEPLRAVLAEGTDVNFAGCSADGRVDPDEVAAAAGPGAAWISVMLVNNETGVIQPVRAIAETARRAGAVMHTDAVQAFGRLPLNVEALGVDAMSLSAHKIGGPPGIGALYVGAGVALKPAARGGVQEAGRRAGTENIPGAAGFAVAAEAAVARCALENTRLTVLRDIFESRLAARLEGVHVNGARAARVPHTSNISFDGCRGVDIAAALDAAGFAVSVGSACHAAGRRPSHVLEAMCLTPGRCRGAVRFSFGPETGEEEFRLLTEVLPEIVGRLRAV